MLFHLFFSFISSYFTSAHGKKNKNIEIIGNLSIRIKIDEKNDPDLIPHDNSDDEKEFERLYTPTKLNYVNRHSPNSISPSIRFTEKQVSGNSSNI